MKESRPIPYFDITGEFEEYQSKWFEQIAQLGKTGNFILGDAIAEFESRVARFLGVKHAVTVGSGTDALVLALRSVGVQAGDSVIIPDFTFFATAEAVSLAGAVPIFVDIEADSFNISVEKIKNAIQPNTKAILPVHLFGAPADIEEICKLGQEHGIAVIEDTAQAFGAKVGSKFAGTFGQIGCFSFYPTKVLGAYGDGGMATTNDDEIADNLRLLRNHGVTGPNQHDLIGCTSRLNAVQAVLLQLKLECVPDFIEQRQRIARMYMDRLQNLPMELPKEKLGTTHVYNIFTVRSANRDQLVKTLSDKQIGHQIYYPLPVHMQKPYLNLNLSDDEYPETRKACREVLSLPNYPGMPHSHIDRICEVLNEIST